MDGVISIYKPCGITSFDAVKKVKKVAGTKKVGHTGTLDPEASGVLPVCIGRATKIVEFLMSDLKKYRAELKLGIITDTYDKEGKIISTNDVNFSEEELTNVIKSFQGEILQIPPMYSALKINGKRLYELARQGIEVERKARKINIFNIDIIDIKLPYATMDIICSKGTYIRSLCYDIGDKLGCGGAMWALERSATGAFNLQNSVDLEELDENNIKKYLIPIEEALNSYDKVYVSEKFEKLLINGVNVGDYRLIKDINMDRICRVYIKDNEKFIGLGCKNELGFKMVYLHHNEH